MVIGEQNEILRFIAGSIIRQLANQGVNQELFWPRDCGVVLRTNFFQSQLDSSQWPELLEGYLDEMDSQLMNHEKKFTPFSYILQLGSKAYSDTAPSFLVTLDGPLSIIIPELTTNSGKRKSSQYVDVPLVNINKVEIQERPVETPTSSAEGYVRFAVIFHLVKTDDCTMFVNAAAQSYPCLILAFDDKDVAITLRRLILRIQNGRKIDSDSLLSSNSISDRSEDLEAGDHNHVSPSPVQRNVPRRGGSWALTDLADGFESNVEMSPMVGDRTVGSLAVIATSAYRIIDKDIYLDGVVSHGEERLRDGNHSHEPEREIVAGIAQSGCEKPGKAKIGRGPEAESKAVLTTHGTRSPLDTVATSSSQWRDGANAIDNAPELASQIHHDGRTTSPLHQPGGTGTGPPAVVGPILSAEAEQLQIPNSNLISEPSALPAIEGTNIALLPTQFTMSTASRKRKAAKVSQQLLNRDGEQVEFVGTDGETTRPKTSCKSNNGASINKNNVLEKKRSSKKKITYAADSKLGKFVNQTSHDADSGDLAAENDMFAIPDSPSRPSKPSVKRERKKPPPKKAKPTKSKSVPKNAKEKFVPVVPAITVPRKTTARARARASRKGAVLQESIQDSEVLVGSDDRELHQGNEYGIGVEEDPLMTINDENSWARMGEDSSQQKIGANPKNLTSKTMPGNTTEIGKSTAIASKTDRSIPAAPTRQLPRRTAAINANHRIHGLKTDGDSVVKNEKLNHEGGTPESRGHVRRSDEARQKPEHSVLEAGPLLSSKSPLNTVHNKDKNESEQPSVNQIMAPSKGAQHTKEDVELHSTLIENRPNPMLTKSPELSVQIAQPVVREVENLHCNHEAAVDMLSAPSIEPRSHNDSIALKTTPEIPQMSDEVVEKQLETEIEFTDGNTEISFADTFLKHKPEAPMAVQSRQLQYFDAPSNVETERLTADDQRNHPTLFLGAQHKFMTTPTVITASVISTSPKANAIQNSWSELASNSRESKTAPPVIDTPNKLFQLHHVGTQTSLHSSSHPRPVQDHFAFIKSIDHALKGHIVNKPANSVEDTDFDRKPVISDVAGQTEDETETATNLKFEKQKLHNIGSSCERHPTTTDNICVPPTTQGPIDATVFPPTSELIEISSGVEASSEEDLSFAQRQADTDHKKEQIIGKRKFDGPAGNWVKKLKALPTTEPPKPFATPAKPYEQSIGLDDIDAEATDDRVQRKTIIIGFDSNGPRNQGITSTHKPLAVTQLSVAKASVLSNVQSPSRKRKHIEEQQTGDRPFSPQKEKEAPIKKLRKIVTVVPPTPQAITTLSAQITSPFRHPSPQLLGSHGTRAQENGSPAATKSQVRRLKSVDTSHFVNHMADNLDKDTSVDGDSNRGVINKLDYEHDLVRAEKPPRIQPAKGQQQLLPTSKDFESPSPRIGRTLPSSSSAPSSRSGEMAKYYEQTSGSFANFEMEDVVQMTKISDPFSDMNQNQSNSFIKMLRATGGAGKGVEKPKPEDIEFTLNKEGVKYMGPVDPDTTLVELGRQRRSRNTPSSEGSSSSSHSSDSKGRKGRSKTANSEGDETRAKGEKEWREALKQHQVEPLKSLHEMSNRLVKHLSSKESTIDDMVTDYTEGGTRLVEGINEAHAGDRQILVDKTRNAKEALEAQLGDLKLGLAKASKEVRQQRAAEIQKISKSAEEKRKSQLEAAMEAFGK
ncbi:hypothetical protein MMC11_004545 [Xylographa trunciseda]|nr:hypothetical protein [Xylographa trunciseda]